MLGFKSETNGWRASLTYQSRPCCYVLPAFPQSLPVTEPSWLAYHPTPTTPPHTLLSPGSWAALPYIIWPFWLPTLFCTFWPPSSCIWFTPPHPHPHGATQSGNVYSGLSQMSLPLAVLSHLSITNFLLHHTRNSHVPFLFLFPFFIQFGVECFGLTWNPAFSASDFCLWMKKECCDVMWLFVVTHTFVTP